MKKLVEDKQRFSFYAKVWFDAYARTYFVRMDKGIVEKKYLSSNRLHTLLDDLLMKMKNITLSQKQSQMIFELFDTSKDGFLNEQEFMRGLYALLKLLVDEQ
jgi:hypothetical protein